MSDKMRVTVVGASGKMGQQLIKAVDENEETTLVGVTEREGHDWIGQDLGVLLGGQQRGIIVSGDPLETFAKSDAVLDFTEAAADGRGVALKDKSDSGRDGITGARKKGDIGFAALRGGDVVGEHALWGRDKTPGEYSMLDVLGL